MGQETPDAEILAFMNPFEELFKKIKRSRNVKT
jgi:hypothetical protein